MKWLNPRQNTRQREGIRTKRTINNTIDIYIEGRGPRFPRFSVHQFSPEEGSSFGDASVRHLSQNHE